MVHGKNCSPGLERDRSKNVTEACEDIGTPQYLTSFKHANTSLYLRTHVDIENGIAVTSPELFGTSKTKYESFDLAYSVEDNGADRKGVIPARFKRRPCEAKIPADRSVTPVTLIEKLMSQHRTIFLYSWWAHLICCFFDLI